MKRAGMPVLFSLIVVSALAFALVGAAPPVSAAIGCGSIITASTTLTNDIGPCPINVSGITIGASNVVLNCAGHSITGVIGGIGPSPPPPAGVRASGVNGVTIKNCVVSGFNEDIDLDWSNFSSVLSNTVRFGNNGIRLILTVHDNVIGNTAYDNANVGFNLLGANQTLIAGNTATDAGGIGPNPPDPIGAHGFRLLSGSSDNHLAGNKADSNINFGYYDTSLGSLTGGTANRYSGDECSMNGAGGSSPTGLCHPQS